MKKQLFALSIVGIITMGGKAADLAAGQIAVDQFLASHEVTSTKVYCRVDIPTPECRTLMKFKNKGPLDQTPAFMMSFSAPFRQVGGAEIFIPDTLVPGLFLRYADKNTADGKFNVEEASSQQVDLSCDRLTIRNLQLGAVTANLSFSEKEALLEGTKPSPTDPNGSERVSIVYPLYTKQSPN